MNDGVTEPLEFYLGDDIVIDGSSTWEDTEEPVDLTGAKLVSTARKGDDPNPVWTKRNALNGGGDGEITVPAPATDGKFTIFGATAAQSQALVANATYTVDVVALLASGKQVTLVVFTFKMLKRPTRTPIQ